MALQGITVTAFRKKTDGTFSNSGSTTTDINGEWEIVGLDATETYAYKFSDPTGQYATIYATVGGSVLSLETASVYIPSEASINVTMYEAATQGGEVD